MKTLIKLFALLLLCSCGIDVDVPDTTQTVKGDIGFKYEEVAAFCDERYGAGSEEAEACFEDYRNLLKASVGVDLKSIVDYCSTYDTEQDIQDCEDDLTALLGGLE